MFDDLTKPLYVLILYDVDEASRHPHLLQLRQNINFLALKGNSDWSLKRSIQGVGRLLACNGYDMWGLVSSTCSFRRVRRCYHAMMP